MKSSVRVGATARSHQISLVASAAIGGLVSVVGPSSIGIDGDHALFGLACKSTR